MGWGLKWLKNQIFCKNQKSLCYLLRYHRGISSGAVFDDHIYLYSLLYSFLINSAVSSTTSGCIIPSTSLGNAWA